MAAVTRQPFAPLDGARLQNLTSLKNRQNAIPAIPSGKRKAAEAVEGDDFENVDPTLFSKRSKGAADNSFFPMQDFVKPSPFVLTKAASTSSFSASRDILKPVKPTQRPRTFLQPKSPAAKINTALAKSSPLSAPAGRSPTRGSKRIGILSRRRTAGPFGRVEPPSFNLGSAAPFSLDAALKGTISSYSGGRSSSSSALLPDVLPEPESNKASWFFDIHEDTPEQEMTNLLQHSTCTLDISSDEESELKARRERDEGRNKENMPPVDDVSQTSARGRVAAASAAAVNPDDMVFEKTRGPLGELNAADYYAQGCDDSSVVIVPGDDEDGEEQEVVVDFEFAPELKVEADVSIDVLMGKESDASSKAAVLQPIDGTGESFELWESGSQQDEAEPVSAPSPCAVVQQDLPVEAEVEGTVAVC
ncbi:hypothetical protein CONLIGDRAFT_575650 [Coniochaeta ligniaria NRRL 30616]|uniref:Thymidylate kinase n=1 Tax=Coniochaeta ligniaria NRRL 30616 TaxID=1408157 RepID=A0A1J7IR45_9PEZI|nr:hypothetical protein CONLIGDRAFT_575650 [Coniochaeta ligniaria NRRL 30616]